MELSLSGQTISFLHSALTGFISGIIYDFFMCLKRDFKKSKFSHILWDIIFIITALSFFFFSFFKLNGFDIRIYHIIGIIIGLTLYFNTISGFFCRFFKGFFNFFKKLFKILLYPVRFLCKIVYRIFLFVKKIFDLLFKIADSFFSKHIKAVKKLFKRMKKIWGTYNENKNQS